MRSPAKQKAFSKETDLCAAFIEAVNWTGPRGGIKPEWTCYPETAGWDILLSRKSDGFQIGIEAKLTLSGKVLLQAAEGPWYLDRQGPDCRAVLVPIDSNSELAGLAAYCAITVIRMRPVDSWHVGYFSPQLPSTRPYGHVEDWHELMPSHRHTLPEYIPDVAAGAPCPVQLTQWKIGAMKLAVLLEATGYLLRADFKRHGIDIRRWIGSGWIVASDIGFRAGAMPNFKEQHPRVWEEIAADKEQWARVDKAVGTDIP